tara:strand:+ start:246 stop:746 length:501 start_codon:yes stop_codon:yes gene_type:complete
MSDFFDEKPYHHIDDYEGNIDLYREWKGISGDSTYRYFFKGPVKILGPGERRSSGFFSSKETLRYCIDFNSSNIIDVDLDTHVRLIPSTYQSLFNIVGSTLQGHEMTPDKIKINFGEFEGLQFGKCNILAPVRNLSIVSGNIPFDYLTGYTNSHYISTRNWYQDIR